MPRDPSKRLQCASSGPNTPSRMKTNHPVFDLRSKGAIVPGKNPRSTNVHASAPLPAGQYHPQNRPIPL